jgi:hypothetical protein
MYAGPGRYGYGWEDDLHGRPTPMKTEGGPPGAHIMPRIRGQQRRNGETRRSRFNQRLGMRAENQRSRLDANKELRSSEVDSVWIVVATMGGDHRPISHGTTCLRTAYWRRMLRSKKGGVRMTWLRALSPRESWRWSGSLQCQLSESLDKPHWPTLCCGPG